MGTIQNIIVPPWTEKIGLNTATVPDELKYNYQTTTGQPLSAEQVNRIWKPSATDYSIGRPILSSAPQAPELWNENFVPGRLQEEQTFSVGEVGSKYEGTRTIGPAPQETVISGGMNPIRVN